MRFGLIAVVLIIGLFMAGCATQPEPNALIERKELKIDPEVIYTMTVTELLEKRIPQPGGEGLLQIQFAVEARSDAELAWKVTWFDASGLVVKGVGDAYRKASVLAGQTRYFKTTAPHARAISYQLHLREPK
ncbi:YcfL family protein [Marinobacter salsuginis]|uniref:YcfL family protein n=1 Tax=Marinobacter salsuginis TaxID=418719 RepID=UPI00273EEA48|nr:YcfL family protein [Marinobacter salsuginis]